MMLSNFAWTIVGQLQLKCSVMWSGPALIVAAAMHDMCMTKGIQSSNPETHDLKRVGCRTILTCSLGWHGSQQGCCQHQDGLQEEVHGEDVCLG